MINYSNFDAHHKYELRPYAYYDTTYLTPLYFSCGTLFIGRKKSFSCPSKAQSYNLGVSFNILLKVYLNFDGKLEWFIRVKPEVSFFSSVSCFLVRVLWA